MGMGTRSVVVQVPEGSARTAVCPVLARIVKPKFRV